MKTNKIISGLLIFLSLVLAVMTILLCVFASQQKPVLISEPQGAASAAETLMEAVCRGDFETAAAAMEGNPDLGVDRDSADALGKLLWEEFLKTFSYEFKSRCYALNSGMARDLTVTYLDIDSVIRSLGDRTQQLLKQRVEEAETLSDIYDENQNYREELVQEALLQAAQEALKKDPAMVTEELTLRMVHENGKWWVVPDAALIHVISCGTAG